MHLSSEKLLPMARLVFGILAAALPVCAQNLNIKSIYEPGDFKLVFRNQPAAIFLSADDFTVARIAARDLASDVERVSGRAPMVGNDLKAATREIVIIGTLGRSSLIDRIMKTGRLGAAGLRGKRESYLIKTVKNPVPNVESALVIVGSDRRARHSVFTSCRK